MHYQNSANRNNKNFNTHTAAKTNDNEYSVFKN